jgi:uncharacterized SAM-binding protein YcdF (DUF218 family)
VTRTAILHLGGNYGRVRTTAAVADVLEEHAPLVIISSEECPRLVSAALLRELADDVRVLWHYEAWDTVSQFTLLWPILEVRGIRRLIVVTDHHHLPRALRVAAQVLVGRGIHVIGVPHLGGWLEKREGWRASVRDQLRALVWAWTGWLWYAPDIRAARMPAIRRWAAEAAQLQGELIR